MSLARMRIDKFLMPKEFLGIARLQHVVEKETDKYADQPKLLETLNKICKMTSEGKNEKVLDKLILSEYFTLCGELFEKKQEEIMALFCYELSILYYEEVPNELDDKDKENFAKTEYAAAMLYKKLFKTHSEGQDTVSFLLDSSCKRFASIERSEVKQAKARAQVEEENINFSRGRSIDAITDAIITLYELLEVSSQAEEEKDEIFRKIYRFSDEAIALLKRAKQPLDKDRVFIHLKYGLEALSSLVNFTLQDKVNAEKWIAKMARYECQADQKVKEELSKKIKAFENLQATLNVPLSQLSIHAKAEHAVVEEKAVHTVSVPLAK